MWGTSTEADETVLKLPEVSWGQLRVDGTKEVPGDGPPYDLTQVQRPSEEI